MKLKKLSLLISLIGCMMFVNCNQIFAESENPRHGGVSQEKICANKPPIKSTTAEENKDKLYFCPCCGVYCDSEEGTCVTKYCPAGNHGAIKNQTVFKKSSYMNVVKKGFPTCPVCHSHDVLMDFTSGTARIYYCYGCNATILKYTPASVKKPITNQRRRIKFTQFNLANYLRENLSINRNKTKAWVDIARTEFIKKALYPHPLTFSN